MFNVVKFHWRNGLKASVGGGMYLYSTSIQRWKRDIWICLWSLSKEIKDIVSKLYQKFRKIIQARETDLKNALVIRRSTHQCADPWEGWKNGNTLSVIFPSLQFSAALSEPVGVLKMHLVTLN